MKVLDRLVTERGAVPRFIRCDNGPELTANALRDWCRFTGARTWVGLGVFAFNLQRRLTVVAAG